MPSHPSVDVSPVPARYRGKVLTTANTLIENGLYLLQVVLFGGIGLAPAIVSATVWPDRPAQMTQ